MALTKVGTDGVAGDAIKKGHIPAGEIEASEIATGAVGTSEIAANAVTPDEIEDGTQGDIMHYTASGVPARLGAGSAGQVLTSGGSGANVSWSAAVPGDTTVTEAKLNANSPTNGQILTADSSAGGGFKWADAPISYNDDQVQRNIAMLGFYRAIDHSKNEYSLTNQIIDDYNDASGIDASASTNEQRTSGYYVGTGGGNATGGTETTWSSGGTTYKVHSFTSTGNTNWVCPGAATVDYLIVAGGGAGGGWGGGGAGGMKSGQVAVTAQTYTITVGAGGASQSGAVSSTAGNDGADSSALGITSTGGGGGGGGNNGRNGGSGGGAGAHGCGGTGYPFHCTSWGSGTAGQGNNGNHGYDGGGGSGGYQSGGGGGGKGGTGGSGGTSNGGYGGDGENNNYRTGSDVKYAAGGGGAGGYNGASGGGVTGNTRTMPNGGGAGIGGDGGGNNSWGGVNTATDGDVNTGSGGGGDPDAHGAGGSGIVVIRYIDNSTFTSEGGDLTLQSTAKTATSAPTTADLVLLIENATGTATLNTDIKGYISRDGSAFSSAVTFTDAGTWGTNKRILAAHDIDLSGIASGTSVKYKITTHNQASGSKVTRVHATSLGWR